MQVLIVSLEAGTRALCVQHRDRRWVGMKGQSSVRLSVCLYVCLYVYLSVCLPVYLSVCLYDCLSVCLNVSICLSVCLFVCLSVYMSVCLFVCLHVCMYFRLSVCLSVCLSCFICIVTCAVHALYTYTSTTLHAHTNTIQYNSKQIQVGSIDDLPRKSKHKRAKYPGKFYKYDSNWLGDTNLRVKRCDCSRVEYNGA